MPFNPGKAHIDGIWNMRFHLAICVGMIETYHILHRAGGLFVVLRFQILVYGYWGFINFGEAFLRRVWIFLNERWPDARQSLMLKV